VKTPKDITNKYIFCNREYIKIGKNKRNDIVIDTNHGSETEVILNCKGDTILATDVSSEYGCFYKGNMITENVIIEPNEDIKIGKYSFKVRKRKMKHEYN
jgi:pSer/pThr/pTyr-binding forkhead associated (FHA) protein